jgi:hypothetical protein
VSKYVQQNTLTVTKELSIQDEMLGGKGPIGNISFSTQRKSPENNKINYYSYSLDTNSGIILPLEDKPISGLRFDGVNKTQIVLALQDESGSTNSLQPHLYDRETRMLQIAPNIGGNYVSGLSLSLSNTNFAYTYAKSPLDNQEKHKIENYNAAVHVGTDTYIIDKAVKPVFLPDESGVLYLGEDGIYTYNFSAKSSSKIFTSKSSYVFYDGITISNDGSSLVVTSINSKEAVLFNLLAYNNQVSLSVKQSKSSENNIFSYPLFSSDNKYIALLTTDINKDSNKFLSEKIVFYDVPHLEFIKEILMDQKLWGSIEINSWSQVNLQ